MFLFLTGAGRESAGSFGWALIAVAGFPNLGAILIRVVGTSRRLVPTGRPETAQT